MQYCQIACPYRSSARSGAVQNSARRCTEHGQKHGSHSSQCSPASPVRPFPGRCEHVRGRNKQCNSGSLGRRQCSDAGAESDAAAIRCPDQAPGTKEGALQRPDEAVIAVSFFFQSGQGGSQRRWVKLRPLKSRGSSAPAALGAPGQPITHQCRRQGLPDSSTLY